MVQNSLDAALEEVTYNKKLSARKRRWASHTLKLVQVMVTAPAHTAPGPTAGDISQTRTADGSSIPESAACHGMRQPCHRSLDIEEDTAPAGPLATTTSAATNAASSSAGPFGKAYQKGTAQQPSAAPVLALARIHQLSAAARSTGAAHLRISLSLDSMSSLSLDNMSSSGITDPSDGSSDDDDGWVHPCEQLSPLFEMARPSCSEAVADLGRKTELNAESVKHFFLQVRPACTIHN